MPNDTDRDLTATGEELATASTESEHDGGQAADEGAAVAQSIPDTAPTDLSQDSPVPAASEEPAVDVPVSDAADDSGDEGAAVAESAAELVPTELPQDAVEPASSEEPSAEESAGEVDAESAVAEAADEPVVAAEASEPEASDDTKEDQAEKKPARPRPRGDRPAISAPKSIGDIPDDMSADDFAAAIEQTVFEFKEGDIVAGTVVRVDPDEVLVDIGYKSEGVIPPHELSVRNNANPDDVVKVGDDIEALVLQKEDDEGRLVLSKKRAQYERAWGRIEGVMNDGGTVTGHVIEVVKGGLIVDIGLRGFLPASLVDLRRVRDLQPFVGEPIEAKVIELDRNRNNVVLSRRAYLEEEQAEQRQAFLTDLKEGDVRPGVVSSVVNFGAFVDLGGMDGLVHVSELSWRHVNHPGEIVTVGDQVKVKVLEVDYDRERISLSIRQTAEDPWEMFARGTEVGSVVPGKVTKTVPFGAFVSVGEGVEGLVHVSEIAMHHVESPELELSLGQEVTVKVTEIDAERRRVSLSIKQALPDWEERSSWSEKEPSRPNRREFQREDETPEPAGFSADSSLEAILAELKERGIGNN